MFSGFPRGCSMYAGGHSDDCLANIWDASGCLPQGTQYPRSLSGQAKSQIIAANLRYTIKKFNLRIICCLFHHRPTVFFVGKGS